MPSANSMSKSPGRLRQPALASPQQWRRLRDLFGGKSAAFVLGNGPHLPEDLSCLDNLFTVGTNRILRRYEPTVLIYQDKEIWQDEKERFKATQAVILARDEASRGPYNKLRPVGTLQDPSTMIDVGCTGVVAAYWAMTLGCKPIYLMGMSADFSDPKKTHFYGWNPEVTRQSMLHVQRATKGLMRHKDVQGIATQEELEDAASRCRQRSRAWYLQEFTRVLFGE